MTTNNHEVIFAIVNSGFAEDVMDGPGNRVFEAVLSSMQEV